MNKFYTTALLFCSLSIIETVPVAAMDDITTPANPKKRYAEDSVDSLSPPNPKMMKLSESDEPRITKLSSMPYDGLSQIMRYLYVQDLGALFISNKSIGFSVARKMREARSIDSPECPFNLQISNLYHDSRQRFFGLDGLDHIHSTIKFIKTCGGNTIYTVDLTSLYTPDSIPQFSLISEFKGMPLTSLKIDFGKHFDESSY